jgi:2-dehydro-3-deoxyglucarate aldolase
MNLLKEALTKNLQTYGGWMQIPSPIVAEILASNPLFDWVCIDLEHGAIGIESVSELCRIIRLYGKTPVVRVPCKDYMWIRRSLDAGAQGIIVPDVRTAQQAVDVIRYAMYPPKGNRGIGYSHANMHGQDCNPLELQKVNDEIVMVMQIEHIDAFDELKTMVRKVRGIDALFIGPMDLRLSMTNHDLSIHDLLDIFKKECNDGSMPHGIHIVNPNLTDQVQAAIQDGSSMMALGTDCSLLNQSIADVAERVQRYRNMKGSRDYRKDQIIV